MRSIGFTTRLPVAVSEDISTSQPPSASKAAQFPSEFDSISKKKIVVLWVKGHVKYTYADAGWLNVSDLGKLHVIFSRKNSESKVLSYWGWANTRTFPSKRQLHPCIWYVSPMPS